MVKNGIVVDEGIEERGGRLVGEDEEGAEDERLDRFLDPEEERGVLSGFGVVGREKIDRNQTGEENVAHSDGREGIQFFMLDEVPDAVSKGDCDSEAHRHVRAEVPEPFSVLAAVAQDEHGQDDIDGDVGERVVLLLSSGRGRGRFVRSGHFMGRRDTERARERAGPLRKKLSENLRGVNGISSGAEFVASPFHAVTKGLLCFLEIAARVVAFLVSDLTVDLEHAFDILTHVSDDGTGECVLSVGVDVHLHDAVVEGFLKVIAGGAGAAVENEVHFSFRSILVGDNFLAVAEDGGLELDRAGLVGAVDVAESSGKHEAADGIEGLVDLHHILGRGVELFGGEAGGVVTIFFATDAAGFDFKDDVELDALLQKLGGDLHVLIKFHHGAIEHVGLEKRAFAFGDALAGGIEKRAEEGIDFLGMTVIGVESNEDVVFLGKSVDGLGKDDGTEGGVIDCGAGSELATTG